MTGILKFTNLYLPTIQVTSDYHRRYLPIFNSNQKWEVDNIFSHEHHISLIFFRRHLVFFTSTSRHSHQGLPTLPFRQRARLSKRSRSVLLHRPPVPETEEREKSRRVPEKSDPVWKPDREAALLWARRRQLCSEVLSDEKENFGQHSTSGFRVAATTDGGLSSDGHDGRLSELRQSGRRSSAVQQMQGGQILRSDLSEKELERSQEKLQLILFLLVPTISKLVHVNYPFMNVLTSLLYLRNNTFSFFFTFFVYYTICNYIHL